MTEILTGMREMPYVSIYEALRVIVRRLPGGSELAGMNDEWIRRGAVAFMGIEGAYLVSIFQRAVALLKQSIQSPDVDVIVCERKIAPHERGYRLELRQAMLIHPFGRPPLTGILICAGDLERFVAPRDEPPGQAVAAQADEPRRFPGRPSARRQIVAKMRERFAAGEADKSLAAEARWLMLWAQNEFPNDTSVPTTSKAMETSLRTEFRKLERECAASE